MILPPDRPSTARPAGMKACRPRSWRSGPLGGSSLHHVLVAIPASSVPGVPGRRSPACRAPDLRVDEGWSRAWPMCRTPVTFGGGDDPEHESVGFRVRGEVTCLLPAFVARPLHLGGRVLGGQLDGLGSAHDGCVLRAPRTRLTRRLSGLAGHASARPAPARRTGASTGVPRPGQGDARGRTRVLDRNALPAVYSTWPKVVLVTQTHSLAADPVEGCSRTASSRRADRPDRA